jgi:Ca2+/H+ antiporter
MATNTRLPLVTIAFPALAVTFVLLTPILSFGGGAMSASSLAISGAMTVIMLGAIFSAVYHADIIAHRVGEPAGTLVLTLARTRNKTFASPEVDLIQASSIMQRGGNLSILACSVLASAMFSIV